MDIILSKPLQVVSASAGSGKTYRLVLTYLELLFSSEKTHPFAYISAMTFTNKAAFEMKSRVIDALTILSFEEEDPKKSKNLISELKKNVDLSEIEIRNQSKILLKQILHNYEEFKIMTIDKFNLRLIRSFSRDFNLSADFEVIINEDDIIEKVIDQLLQNIGTLGNETISKLALEYSKSNLEDGEKWDFKNSLIDFTKVIKSEKNRELVDELVKTEPDDKGYWRLLQDLKKVKQDYTELHKPVKELCIHLLPSLHETKGLTNFIKSIDKIIVDDLTELQDKLFTPSSVKKLDELLEKHPEFTELCHALSSLLEKRQGFFEEIYHLETLRKNYYNLSLLRVIAKQLDQLRKDEQIIRISEFNDMIGELVQNEDAPFLYERLGNRYDHYLLDEFQDTSRMQWLNLVPLVYEGISKNQLNFIVGDPKQSIYRFKNGLAQQFVALPEIYNPDNEVGLAEKSAYFEQLGEKTNLEFNWRSASEIVEFNNNLFSSLSQKLSPETREFYKDVVQTPKSDASGLVNIKATNFKSFKESWEENIEVLIQWIEDCFADGYKGKDICILVLKNKECNKIAMELTNRKYKVVSAEALWVDTDQTVKWIVAFLMKRMWQSNDNVTKRFMNQTIQVKNLGLEEYNQYIKSKEGTDGKKYRYVDEDEFLNDFFKGKDNFYKTYESLHDLVSQFCTLAQIDPLQNHYVHHFLDMVYQFELIHGPDLPEFLAWYEEFGKSNSVNLPQDEETINVMTVHKSKGLEFPVVMVLDFIFKEKAGRKSKFLLKTNKGIGHFTPKNTELIQELNAFQESENEMIITDSFNAFYVALTRPKDRLYVTCVQTSHAKSAMFTELESYLNNELSSKLDAEDGIYKIGERIKVSQNAQTTNEDSIFYPRSLNDFLWFPSIALSNDSKISEEADLSDAQRFGNQFHLLLSELRCEEDIESKLNELILIGEIDLVYKEEMKNQAKTLWQKTLQPLYQDADQIITEQSILWKEEDKISRPDLIVIKNGEVTVIDFKTGAEYKSHQNQVKKYSSLLQKMNFKKVKGALLYTQENKLVWVN